MLTTAQTAIIKATAPVVAAHAEAITGTFYPLMFERYPEVRTVFNQAHQHAGAQPRALAAALVAYATHIDDLGVLAPAVERIVQKHVSLNVTAPQYAIVGECLMAAIGQVLGAAVTADVADAWGAAYWQLAELLIGAEEAEYARKAALPGGWRGPRAMRIARRAVESTVITSFWLEPVDGGPVMDFRPGQYLGLRFTIDGEVMHRNYSLSASPDGRSYRISVKREPHGRVSRHLHDVARDGDLVEAYPPAGEFVLADGTAPVLLLTAGVGLTPALPMLDQALAGGRAVTWLHAALNGPVHAFRDHAGGLAARFPNLRHACVYSDPLPGDAPDHRGFVDTALLRRYLPADPRCEVYFLGPKPFMQAVHRGLHTLGVDPARLHWEFFGPLERLD